MNDFVSCEFKRFGCYSKLPSDQLATHYSTESRVHLELVVSKLAVINAEKDHTKQALIQAQRRGRVTEQQNMQLQRENLQLQQQIQQMKAQLEQLHQHHQHSEPGLLFTGSGASSASTF